MHPDVQHDEPKNASAPLVRVPEAITVGWLETVVGRSNLTILSVAKVGTGQMGQCHRVTFTDGAGDPETVVVKLASTDPTSRTTGANMHVYYREIAFYRDLAWRLDGVVPECHLAEYDPQDGCFTLVLEDVAGAEQGDQIVGCSAETARLILHKLARVQTPALQDPTVGSRGYLQPFPTQKGLLAELFPRFLERYRSRISEEHIDVCAAVVGSADSWTTDQRTPLGIVHGDFRLDNLLLGAHECRVIDWQTVTWGPLLTDAAYFIGGCLTIDDRRSHETDLLRTYHHELTRHGVRNLSWEQCWAEYRRQCFRGLLTTIAGSIMAERTDRGDELFTVWIARSARQILDLDALALLPKTG